MITPQSHLHAAADRQTCRDLTHALMHLGVGLALAIMALLLVHVAFLTLLALPDLMAEAAARSAG